MVCRLSIRFVEIIHLYCQNGSTSALLTSLTTAHVLTFAAAGDASLSYFLAVDTGYAVSSVAADIGEGDQFAGNFSYRVFTNVLELLACLRYRIEWSRISAHRPSSKHRSFANANGHYRKR